MDLLTLNATSAKTNNINCKVDITFRKDGRHALTYVSGLDHFMEKNELEKFMTSLKKDLGAGMKVEETDKGKQYGFQGNHGEAIKKLILATQRVKKEDFC